MSAVDAATTLARLTAAASAIAWDAALGGREPPRTVEDFDPAWMTRALQSRWPGVNVTGLERLDAHSGTTTRARFGLERADATQGVPSSVFVKITPEGFLQRVFVHALGLSGAEVRFYRELAAEVPVRVPEPYAVAAGPGTRRFVLLLEDLSNAGARFVTIGDRTTAEDARAVVGALARLHAAFWESPRFETDLAWVRCYENRGREERFERTLTAQMVGIAERRFGAEMPPEFATASRLVRERRADLEKLWAEGPRTLLHGDCHIGNMFFEGDVPGFFDWQVLGRAPGVRDLSYFLCNSLPTETRREHQQALVEHYCACLALAGGPELTNEWVVDGMRSFALYAWIAAAFTAGAGEGLQSEKVVRAGLERSNAALADLDTLGYLATRGIA